MAFSIEIRKERHESFSALAGFFKQYELSLVAGDPEFDTSQQFSRSPSNPDNHLAALFSISCSGTFLTYM